jgi:hypothetical protein
VKTFPGSAKSILPLRPLLRVKPQRLLKGHSELSIALRAAWEAVRRTISEEKQPIAVKPDADALHRFVGFLEGRLNVPLPNWWEQKLLNAHAYEREHTYFPLLDERPYHRTESGLSALSHIKIAKIDKDLVASEGNRSFRIPSLLVETSQRKGPVDAVGVLIDEERCYVALHSARCSPFKVSSVDRSVDRVVWSVEVWAAGGLIDYAGRGHHWITLDVRDGTLFVFGAGDDAVYVEGFSLNDGSNRFRFSTSY